LIDAEIRRAEAVTRQHFESINAPATTPAVDPVPTPPTRPAPAEAAEPNPADPDMDLAPPLPPLAASARVALEPAPAGLAPKITLPTFMPIDQTDAGSAAAAPTPRQQAVTEESTSPPPSPAVAVATAETNRPGPSPPGTESVKAQGPAGDPSRAGEVPAPPAGPAVQADRAGRPRLEIVSLRLCSRVKGFGSFEPVDPDSLKPSRRIRVYWEMAGLEYEARGDVFVSRLAAHLELRSDADGSVVREYSPTTAEYVCTRRPRDYYASTVVELPGALQPGPYHLRLTQTDLVGNRAATREIAVTIVR
jgi:hypothetical protein